jgi:hypothetical protein
MSLSQFFTPDVIAILIAIAVPSASGLIWLGIVHNKISTLKEDVKGLKDDVKTLSIRIESHILSVDALQESGRDKKQ